jgi:hypothetical protein
MPDPTNDTFQRFGILPHARWRGRLELELRGLVRFARQIRRELFSPFRVGPRRRLQAWRHGFSSMAWVLYGLPENDPALYLGDLFLPARAYKINGLANPILGDKLVLSHLLAAFGLPHPAVVGLVLDGRLTPAETSRRGPAGAPGRLECDRVLEAMVERHPRIVFRPTQSGAGQGVFFLDARDGGYRLNGHGATTEEVCSLLGGLHHYVATGFVDQAAYAREIFPDSANTLRVLTLWDETRREPFVAAVTHRFGSERSAPLDNWHQGRGGVVAAVDVDTATLGRAVTLAEDKTVAWMSNHPDTGRRIEGVAISGLRASLDGLLDAAARVPFCPLIGWDVLITDTGYSVIEANPMPGLYVWQVHVPLLVDPRTRAFFERRRVVRAR